MDTVSEVKESPVLQLPVIEVTDYAVKPADGGRSEEANASETADENDIQDKKRRLSFRLIFPVLSAALAVILVAYKLCGLMPSVLSADTGYLIALCAFGNVSESAPPVPEEPSNETQNKLPPLSHVIGGSSPLGTLDDETLRQMLYLSPSPECSKDEHPIRPSDLSVKLQNGLVASNETDYELDLRSYLDVDLPMQSVSHLAERYGKESPVVLIIHTHGTEAYAEDGANTYSQKDNCRTKDVSKNVVAVGAVMAEYFESVGIPTLHCGEMFDAESYTDAYERSSAVVREFTAIYPSIQYVFDVHRDSVIDSDLTKLRPVTVLDGKPTAQFMCVIGTDERTGFHKEWRTNLAFACQLQSRLWGKCDSLPRRMSVRSASFYQNYAPGSLLLEIGSCGNTLTEAKNCAKAVAEELAKMILEQ